MVRKQKEPKGTKEARHMNELLDEGLKETFPASDPVAAGHFTGTEPPSPPLDREAVELSSRAGGVRQRRSAMDFAVGMKAGGKSEHAVVEAEDALIAALKVKMQRPDAEIMYVRRANKRGDARHPARALKKER